ncbi:hypothetical protein L596_026063 [Steinernema carpocapsae]|uniref:Uncharacterized protein n=1 Tax=Steinernema carpocapsae TaxID=34508 RepID=A0A4U5M184_STECR|nr:hypothetical protein L596_026063 [Steinernema carpocapsae]
MSVGAQGRNVAARLCNRAPSATLTDTRQCSNQVIPPAGSHQRRSIFSGRSDDCCWQLTVRGRGFFDGRKELAERDMDG